MENEQQNLENASANDKAEGGELKQPLNGDEVALDANIPAEPEEATDTSMIDKIGSQKIHVSDLNEGNPKTSKAKLEEKVNDLDKQIMEEEAAKEGEINANQEAAQKVIVDIRQNFDTKEIKDLVKDTANLGQMLGDDQKQAIIDGAEEIMNKTKALNSETDKQYKTRNLIKEQLAKLEKLKQKEQQLEAKKMAMKDDMEYALKKRILSRDKDDLLTCVAHNTVFLALESVNTAIADMHRTSDGVSKKKTLTRKISETYVRIKKKIYEILDCTKEFIKNCNKQLWGKCEAAYTKVEKEIGNFFDMFKRENSQEASAAEKKTLFSTLFSNLSSAMTDLTDTVKLRLTAKMKERQLNTLGKQRAAVKKSAQRIAKGGAGGPVL